MFGSLGVMEILLIFGILVILFGGRKLPEIGKGLGKAISNFKRGIREKPREIEDEPDDEEEIDEEPEEKKTK